MKRFITQKIQQSLEENKVVVLVGQRQVGKTYELQRYFSQRSYQYFDFEDTSLVDIFSEASIAVLQKILPTSTQTHYLLLDEIQYLQNSGKILKLLHDHFPHVKVIATGSASFLLLKNIGDSLFGRADIYTLFPLSPREIQADFSSVFRMGEYDRLAEKPTIMSLAKEMMIYGSFPAVAQASTEKEKKRILKNYINSLLFKDIFEIEGIRNPAVFKRLLSLLALQIGSEVNTTELSKTLGVSKPTIQEYIDLYEKFQIIYQVPAFSTNPRKEISKGRKIYFVDLGLRNALLQNFGPLELRSDKGDLFENLVFNTLRANIEYFQEDWTIHFWRTYQQSEVDIVLSQNGHTSIIALEIKYSKYKLPPKSFTQDYSDHIEKSECVTLENFWMWI